MPRIDPNQLLKCLSVLLAPKGGIKTKDEVSRLASLMTKFSRKLVSKCIYIMILRASEPDLLNLFMSAGGWDLTYAWLSDGITMKNWPLVEELVQLLIICPVDIERLKGNNCPKLIKHLSKDPSASEEVRKLACVVVDQWLAIVKGACESNNLTGASSPSTGSAAAPAAGTSSHDDVKSSTSDQDMTNSASLPVENGVSEESSNEATMPKGVYKITIRDGKKVLAEVIGSEKSEAQVKESVDDQEGEGSSKDEELKTERHVLKVVNEDPIAQDALPPKKLAEVSGKRHHFSLKRKSERKISPEPDKKSPKESLRDKERKRSSIEKKQKIDLKQKSKERRSSKEKTAEEKAQEEKDKQSLMKLITPSIGGLGKIPKKSRDDSKTKDDKKVLSSPPDPKKVLPNDPKKYNISIETRKGGEDRPKTVKTFNSKFRSTGLEEPPPPPKSSKKKPGEDTASHQPPHPRELPTPVERRPAKRTSPIKEPHLPEKKLKEEEKLQDKTSPITSPSTKLKVSGLQESDVFADALTAANPVKDLKKRKRRLSGGAASSPTDPKKEKEPKTEGKETVKPVLKFYQEILIASDEKAEPKDDNVEKMDETPEVSDGLSKEELEEEVAKSELIIDQRMMAEEKKNVEREKNRLPKGILTYMRRYNKSKKIVAFKADSELVSIRHFELDETERVNVTKPFGDMRQMEKYNERMLLQRKLVNEDVMEEKMSWRPLIPVDLPAGSDSVQPGQNSVEKEIQRARERTTLQAIYFNRSLIPDSPSEPDLEIHAMSEPALIPLKDTSGNPDSVISYRDKPWPEPKGFSPGQSSPPQAPASPPQLQQGLPMPPQQMMPMPGPPGGMFPPPPGQFGPQGPMQPIMGPPGMMPPPEWMGNPPDGMMMGGPPGGDPTMMMGPMNPGGPGMPPPGLIPPPPEMFNGPPHPDFMGPPFPMGPGGMPPPGMFPNGPPGGFPGPHLDNQGPPLGGGGGQRPSRPWFRGQDGGGRGGGGGGGGTWRHPSKGGGWTSNKMCKFYARKGSCRTVNCQFRHGGSSAPGKGGGR